MLWWDHLDHLGQEHLHHNLGTMHTLVPKGSSTHRMGAMGSSAVGTGDLLHHPEASQREMWGKESVVQAREL